MLDHCDQNTMTVVNTALEQARSFGHSYLGTEHLLVALVRHRDLLPEPVGALLPDADVLISTLATVLGKPPRPRDAELLQVVGINLDEIRAAVRQTFGSDALDRLGRQRVHQPWQPWRCPSRRCTSLLAGSMSCAPRVKQAFEHARRDIARRQLDLIGPLSLLLGMIDVEDAISNRLLREAGLDPAVLRRTARDVA